MPVDGSGAAWQPSGVRDGRTHETTDEVRRLEAALDRISGALVRRAERDAAEADRIASGPAGAAVPDGHRDEDGALAAELRRRFDGLIGRMRALLDDAVR